MEEVLGFLIQRETLNSPENIIWSSDAITNIVAVAGSLLTALITIIFTKINSIKLEREKNAIERYNRLASLIANYYQLSQIIDGKDGSSNHEEKVIEINMVLVEVALWLPTEIYNNILVSIKDYKNFESNYPTIINEVRIFLKLKPIPIDNLSLIQI